MFTDNLIAYNPKKTHVISSVDLSETMSPLTKFTLNLFDRLSEKEKNLILVLSTFQLKTLPLIAYCYAKHLNKDVFIFCRKQNIENYIKKYCLLGEKSGAYCFYRVVPFEVTDNGVDVNLYLPRAQRRGIKSDIAHSLRSKDRPSNKIFFSSSKIALENIHTEQVTIDSEKQEDIILKVQPGLIIFEDVDDIVYSQESFRTFLDWIERYRDQGIRFIFHFSNPYSQFIELFKQETDSVVLDYNLFFLKRYKDKLLPIPTDDSTSREITAAYNLDDTSLYEFDYEVLPPIKIRNIDIFYANIERTLKENKLKLEDLSPRLKKLRFIIKGLYNLSIHPSNYKVLETDIDETGSFNWVTMEDYIRLLLDEQDEIPEDKIHIYLNIIKNLNQFYQELSQTRRYHDEKSYSSISKNCALLDYIRSLDTESNKDTIINVIVRTRIAKKVLWNDLHRLDLKHLNLDNISICMSYEIRSASEKQAIGISCGPPDGLKKLCYLFANHKNVVFLTYEGNNERRLKKLLNDFNNVNLFLRSLAYMDEVLRLVKLRNDTFERGEGLENLIDIEQDDEEETIRTFISPSYVATQDRFRTLTPYILEIQPIDDKSVTKKIEATAVTRFLCIQKEAKPEPKELAVRHLNVGDKIILLSSDNRRGMLDLVGDIYNLNSEIDIEEIKEWRDKLVEYIELNEITFKEFHRRYKENIGTPKGYASTCNWITNRAIGPDRPADIGAIGKTIGDANSVENSEYIFDQMKKLRSKHVHVGKILNKLVKGILENRMSNETLNYEEQVIYNLLKLYKIVAIEKGKNT